MDPGSSASSVPPAGDSHNALRRARSLGDLNEGAPVPVLAPPRASEGSRLPRVDFAVQADELSEAAEGLEPPAAPAPTHPHDPLRPVPTMEGDAHVAAANRASLRTVSSTLPAESVPELGLGANSDASHIRVGDRVPLAPMPPVRRLLAFFGRGRAGTRQRRVLVTLVAESIWTSAEVVAIITLVAYAVNTTSPTLPPLTEWDACTRPLGAWNILWLLRTLLHWSLVYWAWRMSRNAPTNAAGDPEGADAAVGLPPGSPLADMPAAGPAHDEPPLQGARPRSRRPQLPPLYSRLKLLSTLLGLTWFVTAHILVFTSVDTCMHSAPHLWWLTFAIICITYISIAEILLIGIAIFFLGPLLFVLANVILLCIGRHPILNPYDIKPTIGKLPRNAVERIPLVMYIPAPPDGTEDDGVADGAPAVPPPAHVYPPAPAAPPAKRRRFRFALLKRSKRRAGASDGTPGAGDSVPVTWEDNWVRGPLPFVRLTGNRAACAICLMDFAEPPRAPGSRLPPPGAPDAGATPVAVAAPAPASVETHEAVDVAGALRLEDAGEDAQPLRLLACGHAFHQTCIDPWLSDVSGRCPTCQREVELAPVPAEAPRRWRFWRARGQLGDARPGGEV